MTVPLFLLLASLAAAQSPLPVAPEEAAPQNPAPAAAPAASTATAVETSTAAAEGESAKGGVKVAGEAKPKLARPIHATLHREAREWEPVALKTGGDPFAGANRVEVRLEKVKRRWKGEATTAKASARLHKEGDARWLVVSVFPKRLGGLIGRSKPHFEVRFRLVEGFVEDVKVALVKLDDVRAGAEGLDAWELRARGIAYEEDTPGAGTVVVAALDPRPSKSALNAGRLERASFASADVLLTDLAWSVKGLK